MTVTASPKALHRIRRWAYAPVIVALAVGAAASGASIGSADITTDTPATVDRTAWRVHNYTDQTLTAGDFHRDRGANVGSALAFGGDTPWAALQPGDVTGWAFSPTGGGVNKTRTWGRVCYMGQVWNMPRVETHIDGNDFRWSNMYVFAMGPEGGKRLMVTKEGGHEDIDMNAYGEPC